MNDNRAGGTLLVLGCVGGLVTMGLHPILPHAQLPVPTEMAHLAQVDRVVHGLALMSMTLLFLGTLALTRRLAAGNRLALAALVFYGFAVGAIIVAGTLDGFVAPNILTRMVAGDPQLEWWRLLLHYNFWIVTALSSVYTAGACVAILLWSVQIVRTRRLAVGLGWYGLIVASLLLIALLSGHLTLDKHGMGMVALAQSIWFAIAGILLLRIEGETEERIRV